MIENICVFPTSAMLYRRNGSGRLVVLDSDWILDHVICTAAPCEFAVVAGCITRDRNHSSAYIAH
jgi:hypothetical protein